jgi:lysophospholipase L1-like esterase
MINRKDSGSSRTLLLVVLFIANTIVTTIIFAQSTLTKTIIGDSTVCNYAPSKYPQTGWGQVLGLFFNNGSVTINNKAIGGRSTRSFYQEGRWTQIVPNLQNGEYVFIQFGHNDRDFSKKERYTDTTDYKEYLRKYVKESRQKGAIPVLISPMNMNAWNGTTVREVFCEGANNYRGAMLNVANELSVPFIDLEKKSVAMQKRVGQNYSAKFIHLGLDAGEYPNFPDGVSDGTHFQEMGANFMAKFVCEGISELKSDPDMAKLAAVLKPMYKITVMKNKSIKGMVTENGNSFPEGVSITLKIKPGSGDQFNGWFDQSGKKVAATERYTFTMKSTDVVFSTDQLTNVIEMDPADRSGMKIDFRSATFVINQPAATLVKFDLFTINGQTVFSKELRTGNGTNVINVPVQNMSRGTYLLKMTIDGNVVTERFYSDRRR